MEFKNTTAAGSRAAGGAGPRGTSQDFDTGFERKVRAIVSGCSDQERQVLLRHYNQEIEVFLEAAQMEDTLLESNEHILRVLKIVREISIHRRLDHMNIVSFFGEQRDTKFVYIYLEYVSGGTLEDRIKPRGMDESKIQFYFNQLITGVKYLHSQQVAHRDLKPENLLLSTNEDLKIGDFGLAVEFGKDRHLWEVCGTSGYIAPEVFTGRYRGEPADVWSCGIILFRLLTGQKPWEDAQTEDFNFAIWSSSPSKMRLRSPWRSLSKNAFGLVKEMLARKRKYRATLSDIEQNDWFQG
ncbi:serine/threonine-protein kinase Chk1-like [Oratosquilla oratoria]|uniref:serine/threonine-protein kinase Chk1-like n=1 Tax=Oratosquilla oratoria TaxID=337810 RepID=UPI003F75B3AE